MARIDDLLASVSDDLLRSELVAAVEELRRRKRFGLVFEEHIPETVFLAGAGIHEGSTVMLRCEPADRTRYTVEKLTKTQASISDGESMRSVELSNLLVIKPFGEPVYPVLRSTDAVVRSDEKAFHTVINGENFHALELLLFTCEGQVDCIYIDPPYNTGARDWKYNNNYVDLNDSWRHSKWLSFMEKRLRLAKRLLTADGVLIVTIDEHEVNNLGLLLRQVLPEARLQMVTIVTNTAGSTSPGQFSRAEEYAFFCFFGSSGPSPMETDLLAESKPAAQFWFPLFRSRGLNDRPSRRPNLVYPIAIDPKIPRVVGYGRSLKDRVEAGEVKGDLDKWMPSKIEKIKGHKVIWPVLDTGEMSTWQVGGDALMKLTDDGFVRVRKPRSSSSRTWSIAYVKKGNRDKVLSGEITTAGREACGARILSGGERTTIPKSTWKIAAHDARLYGTTMLRSLIGASSFTYPKSPYAVRDTIQTILGNRPDGLVVDFFAGSGTTLQSVAMLNALDAGQRRVILVTNNEVEESVADELEERGVFVGDAEYEARGICHAVTIPRVRAALTGLMADGSPVEGQYLDGTDIADGFEENVVFFDLDYEDPDLIEVGSRFEDVIPALWLAGSAVGDPALLKPSSDWLMIDGSPIAVLLNEDRFRAFSDALATRSDITHVWLVTDSEAAFARMRERIPTEASIGMLYRDYLRNFRINAGVAR